MRTLFPIVLAMLCAGVRTQASPADEPPARRFGVLFWHASPNDEAAYRGIQRALAQVGLRHELLVRRAEENAEAGAEMLRGFEAEGVDLVFAMGTQAALLARDHVAQTPVVFTAVTNPVESGIVPAWAGSGSNVTGNSNWIDPDTVLQVFRMTVPGLTRLGMLRSRTSGIVSAAELRDLRRHLQQPSAPRLTVFEEVVDEAREIPDAVARLLQQDVQAVWIPIDFLIYQHTSVVVEALRGRGVPVVSSSLRGTEDGAVAGVVVDYEMLGERAVVLALDILLHGARPGELPIGRMHGYQVVVNLAAARSIGYEVPLSLLLLADRLLAAGSGEEADRGEHR